MGKWELLHSPPSEVPQNFNHVSDPVIPDEKNERLLVHFRNISSLYAYYPYTGKWVLLSDESWHWEDAIALVDNVLYFYVGGARDCFIAYDLLTKTYLDVVYSSMFDVGAIEFCDMLNLGNGVLCLASSVPTLKILTLPRTIQIKFLFIKFKVERMSDGKVLITLLSSPCFLFKGYLSASHFMLLWVLQNCKFTRKLLYFSIKAS